MNLPRFISLFLLLGLFGSGNLLFAQSNCSESLDKATVAYQKGDLNRVIELLEPCMNGRNFSSEEKWKAYRLLTLVNIYQDKKMATDSSVKRLLIANPDFRANGFMDGPDLVECLARYRALPIAGIGFKTGGFLSRVSILQTYSNGNSIQNLKNYKITTGFNVGLTFDFRIIQGLIINPEILYSRRKVSYTHTIADFMNVEYKELLTYGEIPLSLKYEFGHRKFIPYIRLGGSISNLFIANAKIQRTYQDIDKAPSDVETYNIKNRRWAIDLQPFAGIGFSYRKKNNLLTVDIRYKHGLYSPVKSGQRFSGEDQSFQAHVDDDFTSSSIELSLAYTFLVYKVYRLKKARAYHLEKD